MKSFEILLLLNIRTMASNFSPCWGSYVLNRFPRIVMFGMKGFHVSASGAIQGHHGPLVPCPKIFSTSPSLLGLLKVGLCGKVLSIMEQIELCRVYSDS